MTGESQALLIDLCAVPGFPDTEPEAMTVSERSPSVLDLYSRRISCVAELPASTPCSSHPPSSNVPPTYPYPPATCNIEAPQPVPLTIHLIGTLSWVVAVIAAAVAPGQAGAPRTATIPLGQAGVIGAVDHAAPFMSRDAALHDRQLVLSRARTAHPTSDLTGRTSSCLLPASIALEQISGEVSDDVASVETESACLASTDTHRRTGPIRSKYAFTRSRASSIWIARASTLRQESRIADRGDACSKIYNVATQHWCPRCEGPALLRLIEAPDVARADFSQRIS